MSYEETRPFTTTGQLQETITQLFTQINILKNEAGYWKKQHERALEREQALLKELQDKGARIRYLERQLYSRKTERSADKKSETREKTGKRPRGQQKNTPGHGVRKHEGLAVTYEEYDLPENEKYCPICHKPFREIQGTDDSEIIEIQEVSGYKRKIRRKKYARGCDCENTGGIITARGPEKVIPKSRYGTSIWIHLLIRKYHFQIPVARILKNLSLHGLDIPAGTVGDGLKRMAPLFEPIYAALEEKSRQSDFWQADETRWSVFESTETKTSYRWYLWVFISRESIVYIMDPTRSAQVIEEHLGMVREGILLVDRYSAYKSFIKKHKGVKLAFCWSHVRRDFIEAMKKYPELAIWATGWEKEIDELFHANKLRMNYGEGSEAFKREDARIHGLLSKMRERFTAELGQERQHHQRKAVLKSLKAHWEGLVVFADHPHIDMDNNGSERSLRNPALGRKNYYGSGAIWSGRFTAVMLSVFETLKLWGINQVHWLMGYFRACAVSGGKPPLEVNPHLPWNLKEKEQTVKTYCGRGFSQDEIECLTEIVGEDSSRNRSAMALRACEQLGWMKANGTYKTQSMLIVLKKMEQDGYFDLPPARTTHEKVPAPIVHTKRTDPKDDIIAPAGQLPALRFTIATTREDHELWNEYIDRYHYLGHKTLAGTGMKYFAYAGDELVALLGFSSAAWRVAPRDWYIEWSDEARKKNLHLVVNNARFLILPWVFSKNLASKILSSIGKRLPVDWDEKYAYKPVLLETFVEKDRFAGTCYKAANWKYVGITKGRGKKDRSGRAPLPKKDIFLYPLVSNFRPFLC